MKYAKLVAHEELKNNDYNFNIPRYISNFVPEVLPDVYDVLDELYNINRDKQKHEKEFLVMMKKLAGTDTKSAKKIDRMIKQFDEYVNGREDR